MRVVIGKNFNRVKGFEKIIDNFLLQIIITRILLDICFRFYVIPIFNLSNYRFVFNSNYNPVIYMLSWLVLVLSLPLAKKWYTSNSNSHSVLLFIYYIQFISFTTMVGFSCFNVLFVLLTILYWTIICFFSKYLLHRKEIVFLSNNEIQYEQTFKFELLITILSGLIAFYFAYVSGFRIDLNILNAYTYRDEARNYVQAPGLTYLLGLARILIPTGIVYSIRKKKRWMLILFIIFSILNYSFDGSKTLYFISIVAILAGIFYRPRFLKHIPFLVNVFMIAGYIEYRVNPLPFIYRLIIRRLYFVPNLINSTYCDYMTTHSPNMFSNLLRFVGYKDSYDISYTIGAQYFQSSTMSANTGTVGDALWQFGYMGIIILPLLIILLLRLLDYSTSSVPVEMTIIPCLVIAYYLNNSSFTAACFSHGIMFFCIIMQLYKSRIFTTVANKQNHDK